MLESLGQRVLVLAAVALLGATAALAVVARQSPERTGGLTSAPAPAGWNVAFAASRGPTGDAQRTTCGHVLRDESRGVTHPALPCGARIVLRRGDTTVLSEVIDNDLVDPGLQLEVTEALAELLRLEGTAEIEWRFATESG